MPDRRRAFRSETIHSVLQHAIGIGHALMLPHVVEPGIDAECLDEGPLFRGILIDAPIKGAVSPALARQLYDRRKKRRAISRRDGVFDGDQHRTSVGLDLA